MYLKSLVLKGFKSFADRSALSLEPGITAVVGPNGSGKSNISDAVLWVLGERNAKHLRGQGMEDVIFEGSSARKSVGVAEVELVLDNSDGTLPVDFNEVSITRRMYRSGESEYLINGSVARRMDVLDILHDSGLGTGTHSIIGQGSLDSILQSKPEDRRALIEEAAGTLKHKQRKAKSERKLAQMDQHLARVRDVTAEVERQLKPLERKAKKARAYQELSGQLTDVSLALAVDDLRCLRQSWDAACAGEHQLVEDLQARHQDISTAEAAAEAGELDVAKAQVNDIRSRVGMPALPDNLTQAEMILRVRHERMVELCYEECRYFDVRRWAEAFAGSQLYQQYFKIPCERLTVMWITKNPDDTYTYERRTDLLRNASTQPRDVLLPIPETEANNLYSLTNKRWQNSGW